MVRDAEREPELPPDDAEEQRSQTRLWLRLLACTTLIEAELRTRMRDEFDFTLARFEILAQLDRQPGGVVLGSLSKKLMVSPANLTPIIARLIRDELITRRASSLDRRIQIICLTIEGQRRFRRMAKRHAEWLTSLLEEFPAEDVERLSQMLGLLKGVVTRAKSTPDAEGAEEPAPELLASEP